MSRPYIHFDDVFVSYPQHNAPPKVVLNHVELGIDAGEFVTLVGPTGCGKSTLLRSILGSQQPTSGGVFVDNKRVEKVSRNVGIVFQRYSLFPHLTVVDNIAFGPQLEEINLMQRWLHTPKFWKVQSEYREMAMEYIERIGLMRDDGLKFPHQLSGGMRQRVAIAQALIMKPKILLMDEPFGALDHNTREEMQLLILEQWQEHQMTILFITHDLEEALYLGTRIIGLSQYWSDDTGEDVEGSKIVKDLKMPGEHPKASSFKYTDEFTQMLKDVRLKVLDPQHRQHLREFDQSHPEFVA